MASEKVKESTGAGRPKWLEVLLPILYFTAMTVLVTWPLVKHMRTSVVGQLGDNIYFVWLIEWFRRALFVLHVSPVPVPFLNYPEGWSLAYTEITPIQILIAQPFNWIGGPTFAYNSALMLTFIISGWGTYLWVRKLSGSAMAGLIAGTIFAFIPYRMAHFLIGHLNLSGMQWFPFYFMGLYDLLELRRWAWKPVLLAAGSLSLIAWTSQYYFYMALFITAIFVIGYLILVDFKQTVKWRFWLRFGAFLLLAVPLSYVGMEPYIQLSQQGALPERDIALAQRYSANPTDFIFPSTDHFLWGNWINDNFDRTNWVEGTFYIGAVSLTLALLAYFTRRQSGERKAIVLLAWTAVFAIILALGINLNWFAEPVQVQVPEALQELVHRESFMIPLPGRFLFNYFPYYSRMRAVERFGVFALFSISTLAGLGTSWLLKNARRQWAIPLAVLILGLVFLDFYPGPYKAFSKVEARPVDYWLADQPEGPMAQFPFWQEESQENIYFTLIHNKPFLGGFFNAFPPEQYRRIKPVMEDFPSQESTALLKQMNVKYILVDMAQYKKNAKAILGSMDALGFKLIKVVDEQYVYTFAE